MGTFYRTIRLIENGIKPVYVFDGKPPEMKAHQLNKRAERREEAEKELQKATEAGKITVVGHNYLTIDDIGLVVIAGLLKAVRPKYVSGPGPSEKMSVGVCVCFCMLCMSVPLNPLNGRDSSGEL